MTQTTQFTCFTSAKVQILTPDELRQALAEFTCFTSTKVQILTPDELRQALAVTVPLLQVLSLLVLLVQKYKNGQLTRLLLQRGLNETATRSSGAKLALVYLLYWYKSTNTDAVRRLLPLLQRGLNDVDTVIRRKACTIVDNMCKMIEQPEEAVAFMPRIMPLVEKASREIADPEARGLLY
jgi:hypothetical protein